jgi:hypothetical protein
LLYFQYNFVIDFCVVFFFYWFCIFTFRGQAGIFSQ